MMAKACKEKSFHRFKEQALEAPEPTDSNWNLIIPQRQSERIVSVCDGLLEKLASFSTRSIFQSFHCVMLFFGSAIFNFLPLCSHYSSPPGGMANRLQTWRTWRSVSLKAKKTVGLCRRDKLAGRNATSKEKRSHRLHRVNVVLIDLYIWFYLWFISTN